MTLPKPNSHSETWELRCTVGACYWKSTLHEKGTKPAARALAVQHRDHTGHSVDIIGTLTESFNGPFNQETERGLLHV